jgi:hypothetical protein
MGVSWLLELDAGLLLAGCLLGTKITVVLGVGRILRWWLLRVVWVIAVGLLVARLVGRISRRRSHPCCTGVRAQAVVATAAGVKAPASEWM